MRTLKASLLLLLVILAASPLAAQSLIGAVSGTVRDEQGGVLPGVTMTLTGKTGSRTATTDHAGVYRFPAVEPGTYELAAELSGFQRRKEDRVVISISAQIALDFVLKVSGVAESLEVVGESPVVDTTSAQTSNSISQDLLFNLPLGRFAPDLLNYAPGINLGAAYGSGAASGTDGGSVGSALLIDGVETRDPEAGTAWSFINYNTIEEVQVQGLGAPAEYGAFTGAIVNSVTRSGGNQFSGLFDAYYTKSGLSSDNRSQEVKTANPTLEPSTIKKYLDWTAQLGGPITKDKLFFFASFQRYHQTSDPDGPRKNYDDLQHRGNVKITYLPNPNDNFMAYVEADDYNIRGRIGFDSTIETDAQTVTEDAPEFIWNLQWRHVFGPKTFLEAKYLGWWGYYYLDPVTAGTRYYDGSTNSVRGSSGNFYYADRTRNEAHLALSHFAEAFGHHNLKFGVQIERSKVHSRYGYPTGFNYYDLTSAYPSGQYSAYSYGYNYDARNHRESFYAQDSWQPNSRLTINAGVRLDLMSGNSAAGQELFKTTSFAPRLGFAWDVTGDHTTVLKGSYSQYYEAIFSTYYERALPGGRQDLVSCSYDGTSQEASCPAGFYEYDRVPYSTPFKMDPNIKQPRVDEWTAGFERALTKDVRLSVTGVWRENKNVIDSVYPDARWSPVTLTIPDGPLTGQPLNLYSWTNRADTWANGYITNVDGFQYKNPDGQVLATANAYRQYKALMFVLSKRFSDRWQGQASYVVSKTYGTLDNRGIGANAGFSHQWETPNLAIVNADGPAGYDMRHEVKVFGTYQIPKIEVGINAYYRFFSGFPYSPLVRFGGDDRRALGLDLSPSAWRTIVAEPKGTRHYDNQSLLDLRLEKIFKVGAGKDKIAVYADINNVFNKGTVSRVVTRLDGSTVGTTECDGTYCNVPFEGPVNLVPPRQVTFGARWSF
jgi:hypothetical protein